LFDQVRGDSIFSNIDLRSRYHQIRIKDEDIHKTTLHTYYGQYEFVVLSFGLNNELAIFMCFMNSVLRAFLDSFFIVFIDDILVYSNSKEEHDQHLKMVLQTLRDNELYGKFRNVHFTKIKYIIGTCNIRRGN